MSKPAKNMRELRDKQSVVFDLLLEGKITPQIAAETTKIANCNIKGVGLQLRYRLARKEKPEIGFLKCR